MSRVVRRLARRFLGVSRVPTYYLPWLTRPGLDCVLVLSNVEARFKVGHNEGPFPVVVEQYDAAGVLVGTYRIVLETAIDIVEVPLTAVPDGYGFVVVTGAGLNSDLYVTLADGEAYTATHGRHEFIERYPAPARLLHGVIGTALTPAQRTFPAFHRDQYVYGGPDDRSLLLLLNLADITNRIRVTTTVDGREDVRLLPIPPRGAHLFDPATFDAGRHDRVRALHLSGNAWFNLYVVGTGRDALAGALSLMHVK
jgi:hypothetical protein